MSTANGGPIKNRRKAVFYFWNIYADLPWMVKNRLYVWNIYVDLPRMAFLTR
ncbi:hypothetical protein SHPE106448_19505 [Shewanella pealeana]